MHRREYRVREWRGNLEPTALGDPECLSQKRLRRRRAEADDDLCLHELHLLIQPRAACTNLGVIRFLVNTAFAFLAALPLEMLHRIGDVNLAPVDSRLLQGVVEQPASRTDERPPLAILLIARLFADDDDSRAWSSFAEHRLRSDHPQSAAMTRSSRLAKRAQRRPRRNEIRRASGHDRALRARPHDDVTSDPWEGSAHAR